MNKGIYCLVLRNTNCITKVGALGNVSFPRGYHLYVGSARGAGGFSRVRRHIRLAAHKDKIPHWHIDYLLLNENFSLISVICAATTRNMECMLANQMPGEPVSSFGCSDCNCISHLFYCQQSPFIAVKRAFKNTGFEKDQISSHHIR